MGWGRGLGERGYGRQDRGKERAADCCILTLLDITMRMQLQSYNLPSNLTLRTARCWLGREPVPAPVPVPAAEAAAACPVEPLPAWPPAPAPASSSATSAENWVARSASLYPHSYASTADCACFSHFKNKWPIWPVFSCHMQCVLSQRAAEGAGW